MLLGNGLIGEANQLNFATYLAQHDSAPLGTSGNLPGDCLGGANICSVGYMSAWCGMQH